MNNSVRILAQTSMPLVQNDVAKELVTTKELAQMLGVEVTAIKRAVQKLGAVLHRVERNNQGGYLFTEKQATLIKQEIQKHHNLATRQIDGVSTELEILENYRKANEEFVSFLNRKYEEEKQKRELAEKSLNRIADGTGCFSMNQTAKALKLPYGNIKLYERLRSEGILNSDNSPKQEQVNAGHFKVVVKFVNEKVGNKPVTLTTGRGLVYLAKRFNTQIDESVRADEQ